MSQIIRDHYKKLAASWGHQGQMSMQDKVIRQRETQFIVNQIQVCLRELGKIPAAATILDVGCGNGYLLDAIWNHFDAPKLIGLEYVPELVQLCRDRRLPGLDVVEGSMTGQHSFLADIIITERSVVNLLSWEEQKQAFENIASWLRPGGFYLMVESFHEPWVELNAARRENNLPEIPVSDHNRYLKLACLDTIAHLGMRPIQGVEPVNALSSHFFLSRIFQHLFVRDDVPASERVWQFMAEALPTHVGNYSPILWHVFKKDIT